MPVQRTNDVLFNEKYFLFSIKIRPLQKNNKNENKVYNEKNISIIRFDVGFYLAKF